MGAIKDSSPRQQATPKPDLKAATMRQTIQVIIQLTGDLLTTTSLILCSGSHSSWKDRGRIPGGSVSKRPSDGETSEF